MRDDPQVFAAPRGRVGVLPCCTPGGSRLSACVSEPLGGAGAALGPGGRQGRLRSLMSGYTMAERGTLGARTCVKLKASD